MADKPYTGRIQNLQNAISSLEGWSFGPDVQFSAWSPYDALAVGTHKFENIKSVPGLHEFAKRLNEAMAPVIADYAKALRQEMANECIKVAAAAIGDEA